MASIKTVIFVRWKVSGRYEVFSNLSKLYTRYDSSNLGVSRWTLNRKKIIDGYENDIIYLIKLPLY